MRVERRPSEGELARTAPPEERELFDRIARSFLADPFGGGRDAARKVIASTIADRNPTFQKVALARLELELEPTDIVDRMREVLDRRDFDASWRDADRLAQVRKTLDVVQESIRLKPGSWASWHTVGWILRHVEGHLDFQAPMALVHALKLWPGSYWTWWEVARLERSLLLRALKSSPPDAEQVELHRRTAQRYLRFSRTCLGDKSTFPWLGTQLESELGDLEKTGRR